MLHLFNKVYVDFTRPEKNVDSIVITDDYFNLIVYAKEHVARTKQKLVLYSDKETFLKFVSYWFKGIFQCPTALGTYAIIKCHLLKENQLPKFDRGVIAIPVFEVTEDEFVTIYNSVDVSEDFIETIKQVVGGISFEFLLTTYLYTGEYKSELKKEIHKLMKRDVQGFITETRESILENSTKSKLHRIFGLRAYTYIDAETIIYDPKMSWFFDVFKDNKFNWDYFQDNNSQQLFVERMSSYLKQWESTDDCSPCLRRLKFIPIVRGDELTDEGLQQIIDFEASTPSCSSFSAMDRDSFNIYYIDYILENLCNSRENLDFLKPYTIKV